MRAHSDFSTSNDTVTNRPTQFVKVRQRPSRYVLVIDTSASMTYRLRVLRQACYIFIYQVLLNGESLAIVEFNDDAAVLQELTVVTETNRLSMVLNLPFRAEKSTSVGAGVLEALRVLDRNNELQSLGGRLIVLTDGQETRTPHIADVINQTDNVLIHTIAIGDDVTEDLETLANRVGGKQFLHQDASTALFDIFSQFGVEPRGVNSEELVSRYLSDFAPKQTETITFVRDNTLRGRTVIYLGILSSSVDTTFGQRDALDVHLTSPSLVRTPAVIDTLVSMYTIRTESSEDGEWTLTISNMDIINFSIGILVLAETEERLGSLSITSTGLWATADINPPQVLPITSTGLWAAADINPPQVQTAYLTLARG
ncbi:Calcium-activated chloride channel regulator 1 [Holothuria leucospilota]|uniref:Calcium-activated chloride channel regulator 1 n=1 Tax=Holothuria leucospilota TaxID=206669 RepID=A0A9Q1BS04_HOLLE|nr:Calcium-activated chloride channel regulator 1 [Holothuria leucospilota]